MKYLLICLTILSTAVVTAGEKSGVGVRPMSQETLSLLQRQQERDQNTPDNSGGEEKAGFYLADNVYYPPSCHSIFAMSVLADSLEIEDGSVWQIDYYDGYLVRNWYANDPVTITQNRRWFSSFQFRITNLNTGVSVAANLSQGPLLDGEYSRQIAEFNPGGEIILTDESRWAVSSGDISLLQEWAHGDYIIIGVNSGWDSSCPFILINSNMNNFVRVKQF